MASSVQRALVVGGTGGIGYAMACNLAAASSSAKIIISGRNKPASIAHSNIEFRPLDASSMRAIKRYADDFNSAATSPEQKLDMLIMTQGVLTMAGRTETPEGIDRKMALHYYGRQLLIRELTPSLKNDAKVITVLDSNVGSPDKLNWDDLDLKNFSVAKAADHCTSMNDAMIQHYAAQQGDTAQRHYIHAYPGLVDTGLGRDLPFYVRAPLKPIAALLSIKPEKCAEFLLRGAQEAAVAGAKEKTAWSTIDNKGRRTNAKKAIWTEEQRSKVAEHTWQLVDKAINVVE
ncbi:NAD(P)-binding protein [Thozetella sp. PMI_491]|nr:NAD(P)-binding protein [Thozetella sp. PMI_491]